MSLRETQIRALCKQALAASKLADVRVHVRSVTEGYLRFGANYPTTGGDVDRVDIAVTASRDGRQATVTGNQTAPGDVRALIERAETMVAVAPVDPEFVGPLGPTKIMAVRARDPKVAAMHGGDRAAIIDTTIRGARARNLEASGWVRHHQVSEGFADKAGQWVSHVSTQLRLECTCRTPDGTGSSQGAFASHARAGLDAAALVQRVADNAINSRGPKPVAPGDYTVVLMPDAVAQLLGFLLEAMDARAAAEGRSFFAKAGNQTKLGAQIFDPRITLWSDPADSVNPASPLATDGRAQARTTWINKGVIAALHTSRNWAALAKVPDLPIPTSVHMEGSDIDFAALIGDIERGILVTRLWYNRMLDPQRIVATGLTRDGTFWIENGKIAYPIKNLRYNDGPVTLLQRVRALGRPQRAALIDEVVAVVPPMVVDGFHFSSTSDAV